MAAAGPIVAVTGCSGFLAGHVIKTLFEDGRFSEVRGTVRDKSRKDKVTHLEQFPELKIFESDLLQDGSFEECFTGVDIVIHCASPFIYNITDAQTQLINPAVNGTKNVMEQAISCGVKRVVVTSSSAAVQTQDSITNPDAYHGKIFTEEDWNAESSLEHGPYRMSKYLAEMKAWEYKNQIEVCTINPSFILGPPLSTSRKDATSIMTMLSLLNGTYAEKGVDSACFGCIDVRDVALAHVKAAMNPEAPGNRFLCSHEDAVDKLQMAQYLIPRFKNYNLPTKFADGAEVAYRPMYSNAKLRRVLDVHPRPLTLTINEMAESLLVFLEEE